MRFANRSLGGSNGQAALAISMSMLGTLLHQKIITREQAQFILDGALKILPSQPNTRDEEARELVMQLRIDFDL